MKRNKLKYLIILVLSMFTFSIYSQNTLTVYDAKSLDVLEYAPVQIMTSEGIQRNLVTDNSGQIEFPFEIEGDVEIIITYIGYQTLYKRIEIGKQKFVYLFPYEKEINEVVVTGSSKNITEKESLYKIDIIDKKEIESKAANNLSEALMHNMNIEIQHSVLGSTINLQGLSGTNVKVMVDGIPVLGRVNGEIDLSQIRMSNIERVEIVEGPLSVIYGSNALAGVINLITKKNQKDKIEASINTYYETIGNYNIDASVGLKLKNNFIQVNGGRYFFQGWNEGAYDRELSWDPKETYFGDLSFVHRTKKDWFHRFKFSYFQDRILDRKDPSGGFSIADDQWFKTRRIDAAYIINGSYKEHYYIQSTNGYNNYQRLKNTYTKNLSDLNSTLKENSNNITFQDTTVLHQVTSRTFIAFNKKDSKYNYQVGYDLNIESGKGQKFSNEDGSDITIADIAAFVSFTYKPTKKLSIQPAVRYGFNSKFTTSPTFSATVKYDFSKKTIMRLSYGMGFRAPTLKELYLDFQNINHNIKGNENLIAEKSHNASASIEYGNTIKLHKYKLKFNAFFNHKYDGIFLSQIENSQETAFTYINSYKYQTLGAQLDLSYKIKHFGLNTGLSYIGTYNREKDEDENLNDFFFRPSFKLNLHYNIKKIGLNFSIFNKLIGSSYDYIVDTDGTLKAVKLETYDMLDFTTNKTFFKESLTLTAGIKNILNVTSINEGLQNGGAHTSGSGTDISTGRSYFVGIKYRFIK